MLKLLLSVVPLSKGTGVPLDSAGPVALAVALAIALPCQSEPSALCGRSSLWILAGTTLICKKSVLGVYREECASWEEAEFRNGLFWAERVHGVILAHASQWLCASL